MTGSVDNDDIGYSSNPEPMQLSILAAGRVYERIRSQLPYVPQVRIHKVADIIPYQDILKRTPNTDPGFGKYDYVQLDPEKPWEIPESFFDKPDAVGGCGPGGVHDYQIRAAFENGAQVVYSEKPLAPTEERFVDIADWLQSQKYDEFLLMNAHFSRKESAKRLIFMMPILAKAYGRVIHAYSAFKDAPMYKFHSDWRGLRMHGGLEAELMIHYITIFKLLGLNSMTLAPPVRLETEGPYETKIFANFLASKNDYFAEGANLEFDLARFSTEERENKMIELEFERENAKAILDFETAMLTVTENGREVVNEHCRGINEYQAMLEDLFAMFKHGSAPPLTLSQIGEIHEPIWQIHRAIDEGQVKSYFN